MPTKKKPTAAKAQKATTAKGETVAETALTETDVKDVVKKKQPYSEPYHAKFGADLASPGDNTRYLRQARTWLKLPPIDIADPKQVEDRLDLYFDFCEKEDKKPSVIGMANWLGVSRDTINSWKRGECRSTTHSDLILKAYDLLEELWVDYMQNGKVNPASGIFLGKNLFGYRDVQDVVVTPNNPMGDAQNAPELADKYLEVIDEDDAES